VLRGRNSDLLEIAGKRASLGDLNRRLLAIAGVEDGVMFTLDADAGSVCRLAALVVAPALSEAHILAALRACGRSGIPAAASAHRQRPAAQRHGKIAARRAAAGVARIERRFLFPAARSAQRLTGTASPAD
jgi:acyl-coenzyme A synthetase/AMP-(fatty) acid ligase